MSQELEKELLLKHKMSEPGKTLPKQDTDEAAPLLSLNATRNSTFNIQTKQIHPRGYLAEAKPSTFSTGPDSPSFTRSDTFKSGNMNQWEGAKSGVVYHLTPLHQDDKEEPNSSFVVPGELVEHNKLNVVQATSIAGNDITSSLLYSSGLVLQTSGRMAPICITMVAVVLYLFRTIYAEVGSALPLNGGTYNALLNTSTKTFASLAACLTILSYTATAVVSASSASAYIFLLVSINQTWLTVGILACFALLTLLGISDSANVATVIFFVHIITSVGVLLASIVHCFNDGFSMLSSNFSNGSSPAASPQGSIFQDLFFGFGTAMLGVTGFETSANYIEEQAKGVFPKTLNNMWAAVSFLNPLICVFSMGVVRLNELNDDFANSLLAHVAQRAAGDWLRIILIIDAAIVLSGGVLTSYIGIVGLVRRLSLDRCLPHFFLSTNSWRNTNHNIILGFFLVTSSLRLLVDDMETLGGVYGIAFLSVMTMFTVANMLLKYKRNKLPRSPVASYPHALTCLFFVALGVVSNVTKSTRIVAFFLLYSTVTIFFVIGMFSRVPILRFLSHLLSKMRGTPDSISARLKDRIQQTVHSIRGVPLMFFAKHPSLSMLNKALMYVIDNEETRCFRIVYVVSNKEAEAKLISEFEECASILDHMYPKITVELVLVEGIFSPSLVDRLSAEFKVPKNFMFMCCPGDKFPHHIGNFGGVRVISH